MKTFTIEHARSTFFTSKEHYIAFRQAWKDHHKAYPRENGLRKEHYFIYKALCGHDIGTQFTPISPRKVPSKGAHAYYALEMSMQEIKWAVTNKQERGYYKDLLNSLCKPFGDTVTKEMLQDMYDTIPNYKDWEYRTGAAK